MSEPSEEVDVVDAVSRQVPLRLVDGLYRGTCPNGNGVIWVDPRGRYACLGCGEEGTGVGWLWRHDRDEYKRLEALGT